MVLAALAEEGISIKSAGCSQGACGQRRDSTGYHGDFMLIQITSTLANQYSVLVIHAFSPFVIVPVERAQALQEKSSRQKRLLIGTAALAVESISVEGAGWSHAAFGRGPQSAGYLHDFVLVQVTRAPAS